MKKTLIILTAFVMFVFQTSLGELIDIFGIVPNLILIFVIAYSLDTTAFVASLVGCVCGIMIDFSDNGILGLGAIVMMYVALGANVVSKKFYYDNKFVGLIIVFISGLIFESSRFFIMNLLYSGTQTPLIFFRYIFPEAVYNSVLSVPIMWWVNYLKNEYIRGI
ncbi:MAG: rod shape-determining protein MreD [Ruminococcaceae bacterium]|nr:rod shape-determining protein MreD [Oscillospiraceae bacterium]